MMKVKKPARLRHRLNDFIILTAFTAIILISLSCHKKPDRGYFYSYIQSDPGKLDPFYSTDVVSGRVLAKFCNGLFRIDAKGKLCKDLVFNYSFNGKVLTARLRDDAFFHDGQAVSADDVVFSFNRIRNSENPTSPRKWIFKNIKRIIAVEKKIVRIELYKDSATFLYLLTMPGCYIISKDSYQQGGEIIGSGPFMISEWKRDDHIKLDRNTEYFDGDPLIKGIVLKIIPEDLTARFEFLNSTLDYFELPFLANIDLDKENGRCINTNELSVHYIALNTQREPFDNRLFRRALNMAVDKKRIMRTLFRGRFIPAAGPIPPEVGEFTSQAAPIHYDPRKAKEIINRIRPADREFTINIKTDHQVALIVQMIQYYLNEAGLNVKIREMEWSALKAATLKGDFEMAYFTWHADYPEVENFLFPLFYSGNHGAGGNRSFFTNAEVDRLLDIAGVTVDTRRRNGIYRKIERIIIDEAPWIFLWYGDRKIALSDRIKDFSPYPIYNGMKGNEITFKEN